jgi:hypothetical protein
VTLLRHTQDVRNKASPTGVCVLRAEPQGAGVVITLRLNPDVDDVSQERVQRVTEVESAIRIVSVFLSRYVTDEMLWPSASDTE